MARFMQGLELSIQFKDGEWWLCGEGEYERGSVLEGQYRFVKIYPYDTREEAVADNPKVPVTEASLPTWFFDRTSDIPYPEFDPADAGESW